MPSRQNAAAGENNFVILSEPFVNVQSNDFQQDGAEAGIAQNFHEAVPKAADTCPPDGIVLEMATVHAYSENNVQWRTNLHVIY